MDPHVKGHDSHMNPPPGMPDPALEAQRGGRLQRAYLAVLAHELRTPLGAIAAAVEVLARMGGQATAEVRAREVIKRQVQHLTAMLESLYGAQAEAAEPLDAVPLDLAATVREAVRLVQFRQGAQRRNRHVGALAPEAVWIKADPAALAQLAICLLDEARAHGSEGAILASVLAEQGHAVLRVQAGPDDAQPAVPAPPAPAGRRSIGLAWVRRLAQVQGGFFRVIEGTGEVGTCYEVRFECSTSPGT